VDEVDEVKDWGSPKLPSVRAFFAGGGGKAKSTKQNLSSWLYQGDQQTAIPLPWSTKEDDWDEKPVWKPRGFVNLL